MARKDKGDAVVEEGAPDAQVSETPPKSEKKAKKEKKAKRDKSKPAPEIVDEATHSDDEPSTKSEKKEKKVKKAKKDKSKPVSGALGNTVPSDDEPSAPAPTSKKRKAGPADDASTSDAPAPAPAPAPAQPAPKKPKQKRNAAQATDEDALLDLDAGINTIFARMDPPLVADYVAASTKRFGAELSPIELSDLYVPAAAIRDTTAFADARVGAKLPAFLAWCVEAESEVEQKRLGSAPKDKGAPHTIVVAGAGMRAADLVRAARQFQKKDSLVAKLFAKHFKLSEQVEFLKKNRTGIAIGTPARLIDLLDNGALSTQHIKRIVIDASHIDQKKRGIMDMKDTMMPLAKWLSRKEFKDRYAADRNPIELLFF